MAEMEMTSSGAGGVPKHQLDDPALLAVGSEPWPPGREEKKMWRRGGMLVCCCLLTLPLLAFCILGRESASTVWLQMAIAKLTAMNNNGTATGFTNASPHVHGRDELLGGLLVPGMDRRFCRSRYESWRYYKHFPFAPSPYLLTKLRAYEARHRRCAPGTPLYAKAVEHLRSGQSSSTAAECHYMVWLPFDGLGNRMLSMVSGFLYALLTGRVLLAALPPDSGDLFCEPFPNTTWRLPAGDDFPVGNLVPGGQDIERSYTRLLDAKEIGPAANASSAATVPAYVYVSLGWQLRDPLFFCGEHQRVLGKVDWLLLYSDLYFVPSMYGVDEFRGELRRLFPEKESVHHLLSRYLLHPGNAVWSLVTRYYRTYLAPATRRIGVQVRMFGPSSIPADDMYNQILNCSQQEHILPETDDDSDDKAAVPPSATAVIDGDDRNGGNGSNNNSTAILVVSLYADYFERLRSRYYEHAAANGGWVVGVFQPSHEERQATDNLAHNQRALAEIYLLSFSEELITSGRSTFGYVSSGLAGVRPTILLTAFEHKVPQTPCRRTMSMEPCNLTPPRGLECRDKPADEDDIARHVKVCEDFNDGVKFFD